MIFHIDLDAFFASIEQRDNPSLRGKPVIVGGPPATLARALRAGPGMRGVVAAASYEARKYDIHSAMPLFKAIKLCPQAIRIPPHFQKYSEASEIFQKILCNYSPFVEEISIDEAYISFYGFEQYYKDFTTLAQKMQQDIEKILGITGSIGIGTNKVIAKIASNKEKPRGLTVIAKGEEKGFLAPLPLRDLPGLGPRTEEKLTSMGIVTIGDLGTVPYVKLTTLFGKYGGYLWEAANGLGENTVTTDYERKSLGAETTFLFDSNNRDFLEKTLYFLILRISGDLRKEEKVCQGMTIKLRSFSFVTTTHQIKLPLPTNSTKTLYEQAKKLLTKTWDTQTPLRLIGISTFDLAPNPPAGGQKTIFDTVEKSKEVEQALDTIRSKFGFWSIIPASLANSRQQRAFVKSS